MDNEEEATRLNSTTLNKLKDSDYDVKLLISQSFLSRCEPAIHIGEDNRMLGVYDPSSGD